MRTFLISSLFAAPVAMGMIAPSEDAPAPKDPVAVTIDLAVDKTSSVILEGNPSTGFVWEVVSVSSDAVKVKAAVMPAAMKKGEPPVCGAPAPTQVTFTGVKPGKSTVVLEYKRPWEKDTPAWKTMTFTVNVAAK